MDPEESPRKVVRRKTSTLALLLAGLAVVSAGCVRVSSQQIGTTDKGLPRYRITCNQSMDHCYDGAREDCPGGFNPISESGRSGDVKLGDDSVDCTRGGNTAHCNEAGATLPAFDGVLIVECR
jgi:hypothetical protein